MPNDLPDDTSVNVQPQAVIDTIAYVGAAHTQSVLLPRGTHALAFVYSNGGIIPRVVGDQSGIVYQLAVTPPSTGAAGYFLFPVLSGLDTSVTWGTLTAAAPNQAFTLVAILDAISVATLNVGGGIPVTDISHQPIAVNTNIGLRTTAVANWQQGAGNALAGGTLITVPTAGVWRGTLCISNPSAGRFAGISFQGSFILLAWGPPGMVATDVVLVNTTGAPAPVTYGTNDPTNVNAEAFGVLV